MDFSLICSEIQELLINNEDVTFPGIGKLVIESQSAAFLQDGLTIAPPSKKLQFIPVENFEQEAAKFPSEGKDLYQEGDIIAKLSGRIMENLITHGEFVVPGLGIFSKKGDSPITFAADPDFNFSPDNFSLAAIALEEIEKPEPPAQPAAEPAKTETAPETRKPVAQKSDVEHKKDCRRKWLMATTLVIILLAVLILFAILFKEDVMPLLQKILYTEEELEIIQKWAAQ